MSEPTSSVNMPLVEGTSDEKHPEKDDCKRHLGSAALSALVPGTGQFVLGRSRKATFFLVIFVLLLLGDWPLRIPRTYLGFTLLVLAFLAIFQYSACDALFSSSPLTRSRPSKWWLLFFIPLAFISAFMVEAWTTRAAGFRSFSIPSTSMENTLVRGDKILVDSHYYHARVPDRGDLIVFLNKDQYFIKRIIAIGGDTIEGTHGMVFLNGKLLNEPYVQHIREPYEDSELNNFGPTTIPSGKYFVMGDNRDVSLDSRFSEYGMVLNEAIIGKPLYIYYSAADRSGKTIH